MKRRKKSEREQRYTQYLTAHREIKTAKQAFVAMKKDGIIASSTYFKDCSFLFTWFKEEKWPRHV